MANEPKTPPELSLHPSDPPGNGHDGDEPSAPALCTCEHVDQGPVVAGAGRVARRDRLDPECPVHGPF